MAMLSLYPFSVTIQGAGITANYFMLFFVIFAFYGYQYSELGFVYLGIMLLSYIIGLVLFSNGNPYFINKQFLSLIAGIIPILLLFIKIRIPFNAFKLSVLAVVIVYCLLKIYGVVISDVSMGTLAGKGAFGSQRYGFILIFGLLFSIEKHAKSRFFYIISAIILFGIYLTYSRAVYLTTLIGLSIYPICIIHKTKNKFFSRVFKLIIKYIFISFIAYFVVNILTHASIVKIVITLFDSAFLAFKDFLSGNIVIGDSTSEGTRLLLWKQACNFIIKNNIFFGSGMAGLYLVVPEYLDIGASTHSQYVDVFLRTGVFGLIVYLIMWAKLIKGYWVKSPAVFAGLVSMFVYGFFHETTKLTQGAFIFFILLNLIMDKTYWKYYEFCKVYKKPGNTKKSN